MLAIIRGLNQRRSYLKSGKTSRTPCLKRGLGGGLSDYQGISVGLSIWKVAISIKKVLGINHDDWIARAK